MRMLKASDVVFSDLNVLTSRKPTLILALPNIDQIRIRSATHQKQDVPEKDPIPEVHSLEMPFNYGLCHPLSSGVKVPAPKLQIVFKQPPTDIQKRVSQDQASQSQLSLVQCHVFAQDHTGPP